MNAKQCLRSALCGALWAVIGGTIPTTATAQPEDPGAPNVPGPAIQWRLVNNFMLMERPEDLDAHRAAFETAAETGPDELVRRMEYLLQADAGREGWAARHHRAGIQQTFCVEKTPAGWHINGDCRTDGTTTDYIYPKSYAAAFVLNNAEGDCRWAMDGQQVSDWMPCETEAEIDVPTGQPIEISVERDDDEADPIEPISVEATDVLIAGIGDSIASGEGNPGWPVDLEDRGFCFERYGRNTGRFQAPTRQQYRANRGATDCHTVRDRRQRRLDQAAMNRTRPARWFDPACHRSLYGNQFRTALALAVANPQVAVIYLPLGCTGATISEGILGEKDPRERYRMPGGGFQRDVPAQLSQIRELLDRRPRGRERRPLDLVLLTIGANDAGFSELVAHVMFDPDSSEIHVVDKAKMILKPEDAAARVRDILVSDFEDLRDELQPLVRDEDLSRVVFISYPNPGLYQDGKACRSGRRGFDIHPAFSPDADRLSDVIAFVDAPADEGGLLATLEGLAACDIGDCAPKQVMTFVDDHQAAFQSHGYCASASDDPAFDRNCLRADGQTFLRPGEPGTYNRAFRAANCDPATFEPYAKRARWIRTPVDAYLAATTYPAAGLDLLDRTTAPNNPHDPYWGLTVPLYSGAIHPTAEGHAAIADATVPVAAEILGLDWPEEEDLADGAEEPEE